MFLHEWLMWKFRAKHQHGCFLRGLCMYTNWKMTSIEINTQINHFYLYSQFPSSPPRPDLYSTAVCCLLLLCVEVRCGAGRGASTSLMRPMKRFPKRQGLCRLHCNELTVICWDCCTATATTCTASYISAASVCKRGEQGVINMDRSREISISWWLTQSLPSTHIRMHVSIFSSNAVNIWSFDALVENKRQHKEQRLKI